MELKTFDGRRLHRAWWLTPFFITFRMFIAFCVLSVIFTAHTGPYGVLELDLYSASTIALWIAGFFGLIALMRGLSFAKSTQQILKQGLGVSDLPATHPITQRVHRMAETLSLPPPRVAVMQRNNAYAIGSSRKDAAVVIGVPLIQKLSSTELDAIIGHELGHIVSGDMRRMQFAEAFHQVMADFSGAVGTGIARKMKSRITAALVHNIGLLVQHTIFLFGKIGVMRTSRKREYAADAIGAVLTTPESMASALRKIHEAPAKPSGLEVQYACLMFRGGSAGLFSTHPTLQQRLNALEDGREIQKVTSRAHGRSLRKAAVQALKAAWSNMRSRWQSAPELSRDIHSISLSLMFTVTASLAFAGGLMVF